MNIPVEPKFEISINFKLANASNPGNNFSAVTILPSWSRNQQLLQSFCCVLHQWASQRLKGGATDVLRPKPLYLPLCHRFLRKTHLRAQ